MNTRNALARLFVCLILCLVNSCAWQKDEISGIGKDYTPSYEDDEFYYYNGGGYPSYLHGYVGLTYGYSYYHGSRYQCPICNSHPCKGHSGRSSNWAHHESSRSSSGGGSHSQLYLHKSGGVNGGASEAHPKDWFTSRGYSPSRLEKTDHNDHGHSSRHSDHDSGDHRKSSSLSSHSFSPSFVDRVKSEVHVGNSSSGGGSSSSNHSGSDHHSSSSSKKDDDSSGKKH